MRFRIVVETVSHDVYEVEADNKKEAISLYHEGDSSLVQTYNPNWPDRQEPEVIIVEEIL